MGIHVWGPPQWNAEGLQDAGAIVYMYMWTEGPYSNGSHADSVWLPGIDSILSNHMQTLGTLARASSAAKFTFDFLF